MQQSSRLMLAAAALALASTGVASAQSSPMPSSYRDADVVARAGDVVDAGSPPTANPTMGSPRRRTR